MGNIRAGGIGPAMAGPTFWQNYKIFVTTRHISAPHNFRSLLLEGCWGAEICLDCVGGRGSTPDPAGGALDAPPDPLVGWGGGSPLPKNPRRRVDARHLRCLIPSVYPPLFLAIHHWTSCNLSVLLFGNISHKIHKYGRIIIDFRRACNQTSSGILKKNTPAWDNIQIKSAADHRQWRHPYNFHRHKCIT